MLSDAIHRSSNKRVLRLFISARAILIDGTVFSPEFAFQGKGYTFPIQEMENRLDLNVVYGDGKRTKDNPHWPLGKAKRAEVLIPSHIPSSLIQDYEWVT
jgi:hypothetical protein